MRWTDPPSRRELVLVCVALIVFWVGYSVPASSARARQTTGNTTVTWSSWFWDVPIVNRRGDSDMTPETVLGRVASNLWGGKKEASFGEEEISFGDSDGSEVTNRLRKHKILRKEERYGAMWVEPAPQWATGRKDRNLHRITASNGAFMRWGKDIPTSKVIQLGEHHAVLDSLIMFNGTVYAVADDNEAEKALDIAVRSSNLGVKWVILQASDADQVLGPYGGIIRDMTWISTDSSSNNMTIFALWRAHVSHFLQISSFTVDARHPMSLSSPPYRLFLPTTPRYADADPPRPPVPTPDNHLRRRSDTGWHPHTVKAAFPSLTVMYLEDWKDYMQMGVPFVIERAIVGSAYGRKELSTKAGDGNVATVFKESWMDVPRSALASFLDFTPAGMDVNEKRSSQFVERATVVTYIHRQTTPSGPRLSSPDHEALVKALKKLEILGCKVHIVPAASGGIVASETEDGGYSQWEGRMRAVVQSSIIIGVGDGDMIDAAFMHPSRKEWAKSSVFEFFSPAPEAGLKADAHDDRKGSDINRAEMLMSLGLDYVSWCGETECVNSRHLVDQLEATTEVPNEHKRGIETQLGNNLVRIDVEKVTAAVKERVKAQSQKPM